MIFSINTSSDISKLLYVIREICRQFWNITSGIYAKYHVQIMLLFVYTTTLKRFVIFTCRYFKLSWNTTALSQSNCRNFSCTSITEGNPGLKLNNIELKRLFEFAAKENHFLFKVSFYDQGDGEALGSHLAPVLPNHFMGHHENIWWEQYGDSEVLSYRRYVDDTFCLFHTEQDTTLTFNYINNQHPNEHFTI